MEILVKPGWFYRDELHKMWKQRLHTYPELFDFSLNVTLREVFYIGQLKIHFCQPHQDAVSGCLKILSLTNKVLCKNRLQLALYTCIWYDKQGSKHNHTDII